MSVALFWSGHTLTMSYVVPQRHVRQSNMSESAHNCARLYAWSGAVPVVFAANPVDAAAVTGRDARRASRLDWNALLRV